LIKVCHSGLDPESSISKAREGENPGKIQAGNSAHANRPATSGRNLKLLAG
jgi:hypothetical protein